jgi:Divergent InlB B-repeat domain
MKSTDPVRRFDQTQKRAATRARNPITNLLSVIALTTTFTAQAATIVVNGSDDTIHAGNCTLRAAIASMNTASLQGACSNTGGAFGSGDVINFAPAVTTITLDDSVNNSLNIAVDTLFISGTGVIVNRPVAATNLFRIFNHAGLRQLTLQGLTIVGGRTNATSARGGGIFSTGRLSLQNVRLQDNQTLGGFSHGGAAHSDSAMDVVNSYILVNATRGNSSPGGGLSSFAFIGVQGSTITGNETFGADSIGGGIAASGGLDLISTDLSFNRVIDNTTGIARRGGGAYASGPTRVINSRVAANEVERGEGGGVAVTANGGITVEQSTFEGNIAAVSGGALFIFSSGSSATITNSTFVANAVIGATPNAGLGGAILNLGTLAIRNSTFAFNRTTGLGGAIFNNGGAISLNSTLLSSSISESAASPAPNVDIHNNSGVLAITGANSLVRVVANITLPADTLTSDPLLGPLADNGCLAPAGVASATMCPRTLLLSAGSPAINAGNNIAGALYDQRGAGFPRVVGAAADIGAVEVGGATMTTWPINVTISGAAGGGGVSCAPNPVPNGQNASCQAAANQRFQFVAFSGDCTGATCTLTNVTSARNITATFAAIATTSVAPVPTLGGAAMGLLALALFGLASSRRGRSASANSRTPS